MRLFIAFAALFLTSFLGHAQKTTEDNPATTRTTKTILVQKIETKKATPIKSTTDKIEVARLHKHKNNRIIKALAFDVKANQPKMA
ncbi:hypothetical protein SAMN04488009_3297 [Maribacter sedimenticola]|uniref:Uncharacterized protein n=1 Tax=Maribacter sedimenticola TaxID=228956 RepID=A0ABY1SLA3_9FLAO|nr:hypothetical protein [Maribacter sedimenticola]SNR70524.1 hypothetical protein SAMN04488009_3297 [Maribacter sedimenticola]